MKLIGLSGPVGVGKDTVADYLVDTYGFTKFSFSDALYEEVAQAFGIDKAVLYERSTKETPLEALQFFFCKDLDFRRVMDDQLRRLCVKYPTDAWCSPRQITQWWGTEYRRAQNPQYWIERAEQTLIAYLELAVEDPSRPRAGLVNCSVRFPNELAFIEKWGGEVWHIQRPDWDKGVQDDAKKHVAEKGLTPRDHDKVLVNNGTIEQVHTAASLLLSAKPGARIETNMNPAHEFARCTMCETLHEVITRDEALLAIKTSGILAESARNALNEDDFRRCDTCSSADFEIVPMFTIAPSERGTILPPILLGDPV